MNRKQAIMVNDNTTVNVATGDRYRVVADGVMRDASPCEPFSDALARHGFGTDESGSVIVSEGGVTVTIDAPDVPQGVGLVRFYGHDGETLDAYVRGGLDIVADGSSLDVPCVSLMTTFDDMRTCMVVRKRVVVDGNVVSVPDLGASMTGPAEEDYAADLIDALRRLCDALDDRNDRLYATIAPFVCGITCPGAVAPVDWLVGF